MVGDQVTTYQDIMSHYNSTTLVNFSIDLYSVNRIIN